jgi:rhodanese-related sulfurtransferase
MSFGDVSKSAYRNAGISALVALGVVSAVPGRAQPRSEPVPSIFRATLQEPEQRTPEISTEEMRQALASGGVVLDARPRMEYAIGHIPGAANVAAMPGLPMAQYISDVAEVGRLVHGDRAVPLVLYCNGPFCGKSKRLSGELIKAGYTHVSRFQLGIPVWRALGGVAQIEPEGLLYVLGKDSTAVFIDTRSAAEFQSGSIPGARNIPLDADQRTAREELEAAKNDGRLPMHDHNTRVIVFDRDGARARRTAESIAHEAFDNVAFYGGAFEALKSAVAVAQLR